MVGSRARGGSSWREDERTTGSAKCRGARGAGARQKEGKNAENGRKGDGKGEVIVEGGMKGARDRERGGGGRGRAKERERETCERALGEMVGLGSNRHGYGA